MGRATEGAAILFRSVGTWQAGATVSYFMGTENAAAVKKYRMEDLNLDLYHDLRAKTLANNLTWLASFGCQIVRQADVIQVRHSDLPSYNANIVVGLEPQTAKHLES